MDTKGKILAYLEQMGDTNVTFYELLRLAKRVETVNNAVGELLEDDQIEAYIHNERVFLRLATNRDDALGG